MKQWSSVRLGRGAGGRDGVGQLRLNKAQCHLHTTPPHAIYLINLSSRWFVHMTCDEGTHGPRRSLDEFQSLLEREAGDRLTLHVLELQARHQPRLMRRLRTAHAVSDQGVNRLKTQAFACTASWYLRLKLQQRRARASFSTIRRSSGWLF